MSGTPPPDFQTYIDETANEPELTFSAVLLGAVLGIIFGASSLYLALRVGLTVSASIPVAVLSITLFRIFNKKFGLRRATILENNIVQTTGSAGESIAFGVGVTMPALMILGYDMELGRVMLVAALGGLLGILMMIPLRRAFIVKQHKTLPYPEGTACAKVLIVGEEGGSSAKTVFTGFGLAFIYQILMQGTKLWKEDPALQLWAKDKEGKVVEWIAGYKAAVISCEMNPILLGVGYIIGFRVAAIMVSGGFLAYLILTPAIALFGGAATSPILPGTKLISAMSPKDIRNDYILYIGAGAVAMGGLISMVQALPLIFSSIGAGLRDMRGGSSGATNLRTDRDIPFWMVGLGALGLIVSITLTHLFPEQIDWIGRLVGALIIAFFGFLFVTVSSRLTGEIGSSSNPISGMTVATLLLTCLIFVLMGWIGPEYRLTALSIAGIVCIASSNGGTTSQDLKTGYLIGATPWKQQVAILIGAFTSALVIGGTLLLLNDAGTVVTSKAEYLPTISADPGSLTENANGPDGKAYKVWRVTKAAEGVEPGKYLVDDTGKPAYRVDPAINGRVDTRDDGSKVIKYDAPKAKLMSLIIDGVMTQNLPWGLVLLGALISVTLQLSGVPSLAFAVGVYLPLSTSMPIFLGGLVRLIVDRVKKTPPEESDSSPAVLLSTGYIAGGSIAGILIALFQVIPGLANTIDLSKPFPVLDEYLWPALLSFGFMIVILALVGLGTIMKGTLPEAKKYVAEIDGMN